jgi:uncharacterized membrane protein YbhN (UPF0104 family)
MATCAAGATAGAVLLSAMFPLVAGAPWRAIATTVAAVPVPALAALVGLWAAGLLAHTLTLTAALPGLTHRRAILLSLTGSAVSNVLPLGGAAGIALNYRMTRSWGFTPARFASYTVVTNLWDVLLKLFLPVLVVPLLVLGLPVSPGLAHLITLSVVLLPVLGALAALVISRPRVFGRLGDRVERVRSEVAEVVGIEWRRLTLGMCSYTLLLFALLASSLAVTGAGVPPGMVLLAFCAERLATLAGLTPGGLGLVEVGLAAALMLAPGADPAGVAAGALLYRALTFGLEIPVGGLLLAGWAWRGRATG